MTSQSSRIYLYKITFEEVPYYYYGIKKEKYFNQKYWGSPVTHKLMWNFYTPKKQILQFFEFTDDGYIEAQEIEKRIIASVINDKWCLNENVGGKFSTNICIEGGKKAYELGLGVHNRSKEQMSEDGKKGAEKCRELGIGIFGLSKEQKLENCKKAADKSYRERKGFFSMSLEESKIASSTGGKKCYENKLGAHGRTKEQMSEDGKIGGKITFENKIGCFSITPKERKEINKKINSQKWMCLETGYITNSGALTMYQKAKGIDTSKRKRLA
jgi:hypothetical protein